MKAPSRINSEREVHLKICVQINETIVERPEIVREIISTWPDVSIISSLDEETPAGTEGLLVVGHGRNRDRDSLLLIEDLNTNGLDREQIVFQINSNLGKMFSADLTRTTTPKPFDKNAQYSRRDLFGGFRSPGSFLKTFSTAPVIYNSICEAKYGCSKCVEACPTQALSVANGQVILKEQDCSLIGTCTSVCPVSAIQLPRFSESQYSGLIRGITMTNPAMPKRLVLTCQKSLLNFHPWTYVEEVKDIGVIGARQIAIALSAGISSIIVYCIDGKCAGKSNASQSVSSINALIGGERPGTESVAYFEGLDARLEVEKVCVEPSIQRSAFAYDSGKNSWTNYVNALRQLAVSDGSTLGLGLTDLKISDSCTLCQVCEKYCPHSALKVTSGSLEFDSSRCTGCGQCARVCPEHSITLRQLEKVSDIQNRPVFKDAIVNCARCGEPIGSARYLQNVRSRLGKDDPMMNYCNSCKQQISIEKLFGKKT